MTDLPATMMAAYITEPGGAADIRYGELPLPACGPTDVVVRVTATAVNPVDTYIRSGVYHPAPLPTPFVIGRDLAGTVAAAGAGAARFRPGEPVWCHSLGHHGRQGVAAQYAVVAADRLYRLPDGVDPIDAAALAHPAATAHLALFRHARLSPTETLYVAGGAGNVGSALIEFAVGIGARVVASASERDLSRCRQRGADVALDYRGADLTERIRAAAPEGIDVFVDTSGHQDLRSAVELLAPRGRIVLLAGRDAAPLPVWSLYTNDAAVLGFAISNATVDELAATATAINQRLTEGALTPTAVRKMPLADAARAHELVESGSTRGERIILLPE